MNNNENNDSQAYMSDNGDYNTASILSLRLDTSPLLMQWELYLKGEYITEEILSDGTIITKTVKYAKSKANTQGIYSIMSWLKSKINPQIVQGNIRTFDDLNDFMSFFRMNLSEYLMINLYNFEITEFEFEGILDNISSTLQLFLSRLVNNKERDSYNHTIQHTQKSDTVIGNKSRVPFI